MQTRRDYAASLGLAKAGARGKFSNEAKAAIAKAEAEGMKFSDTGNPVKTEAVGKTEPDAPVKSDPRDSTYILPSDFRFPVDEYQAIASIDGKRVVHSVKECCNTCKVSLTNHACDTPTVHGIPVKIERR